MTYLAVFLESLQTREQAVTQENMQQISQRFKDFSILQLFAKFYTTNLFSSLEQIHFKTDVATLGVGALAAFPLKPKILKKKRKQGFSHLYDKYSVKILKGILDEHLYQPDISSVFRVNAKID